VAERFCTGDATDQQKFQKWAETVPQTLRNPLYHWTHLELKRYFDVHTLLGPETADAIYQECNEKLQTSDFSTRNLIRRMNVKLVCTTDDPADSLEHHQKIADDGFEVRVLPTFRPDKSMNLSDSGTWNQYIDTLRQASGIAIATPDDLLEAIDQRHAFFHTVGCRLSDHGVSYIPVATASASDIDGIMTKALAGETIEVGQRDQFSAWLLYEVGKMNHTRGWAQQFHIGAFRNTNGRMLKQIGVDAGFDSIADYRQGPGLVSLLDRLDSTNQLSKTVLYSLNPSDNELIATMIGNYQDGTCPGKMQMGSGWWFQDQKDGMEKQMNALSVLGLLSRFVGMLTDSRSFLSYPRHEYFRRILCNLVGQDVEAGEIPADMSL
jgi:glucuronate isomerase